MAKVLECGTGSGYLLLNDSEIQAIARFAQMEEAEFDATLSEIVTGAVGHIIACTRDDADLLAVAEVAGKSSVTLIINYPADGKYSQFDGTDKGFVARLLMETLDMAVSTVLATRRYLEITNVVERKGEGNGACGGDIP